MTSTITPYNNFVEDVLRGNINLLTHTFKGVLVNGYTFDATHANLASIGSKLSTGNGYTVDGKALTHVAVSFVTLTGRTKWDADDLIWTATGGTIGPATGLVIYSDTSTVPSADRLVLYVDFGGEQSATNGKDLVITFGANGIISIGKT